MRRTDNRPDGPDRRSFPRPPLWLNLLLLFLGVAVIVFARQHRERVSERFADVISRQSRTPADVEKLKDQLAEADLTRDTLQRELDGRLKLAANLKSEDFYLSVDTQGRKLRFYYGDKVLRETGVTVGEGRTVQTSGKTWTFIPVKGAFHVEAKIVDHRWRMPEWVYAMKGENVPASRPVIEGGLGRYVIFLPNGYVIHSPPVEESPLDGAKPGSFMVDEEMLRAIWPRIHKGTTQVFIF
jgi:hypothetical protein